MVHDQLASTATRPAGWFRRPVSLKWTLSICLLIVILIGGGLGIWEYRLLVGVNHVGHAWLLDTTRGTWGFKLDPLLIPLVDLEPSRLRKDDIPALDHPLLVNPDEATDLAPESPVIGVSLNGEDRAYPLNIVAWHECINDTLGGEPIAVVHSPLSYHTLVFSRRTGGQICTFGLSGLIYTSSVLLFDRQADPNAESLWSPLEQRAISGPAARRGLQLEIFDVERCTWECWQKDHPETTALSLDTGFDRQYDLHPFSRYLRDDKLIFQIPERTERRPDLNNKDVLLLLWIGGVLRGYALPDLVQSKTGAVEDTFNGDRLRIALDQQTDQVSVHRLAPNPQRLDGQADLQRAYAYWFAVDVAYPEAKVFGTKTVPAL